MPSRPYSVQIGLFIDRDRTHTFETDSSAWGYLMTSMRNKDIGTQAWLSFNNKTIAVAQRHQRRQVLVKFVATEESED